MKKTLSMLLVVAMLVCLLAGCGAKEEAAAPAAPAAPAEEAAAPASKPVTIRFADFHNTDTVHDLGMKLFAEKVAEVSGGNITVEMYPNAQLGSQVELVESVKNGTIEMTYGNATTLTSYAPEIGVMDLAFMWDGYGHAEKALYGEAGQAFTDLLLEKTGMRILSFVHSGFRDMLTADTKIEKIDDFSGVIFRSPESNVYISMFNALGASPTALAWGEVYQACKTGVVDGLETTIEAIVSNQFWEVCKYVMVTEHIYTAEIFLINEDFYAGLTAEQQGWVDEAIAAASEWINSEVAAKDSDYYKTMTDNGMELIKMDKAELVAACEQCWAGYIAQYPEAQAYIDLIDAAR